MINLSNIQREGIRKLIEGLQALLVDSQVFNLYGFDAETEVQILSSRVYDIDSKQIVLSEQLESIKNIVKPDETDVYNINRRIELLAQRVAVLESKKRWFR